MEHAKLQILNVRLPSTESSKIRYIFGKYYTNIGNYLYVKYGINQFPKIGVSLWHLH